MLKNQIKFSKILFHNFSKLWLAVQCFYFQLQRIQIYTFPVAWCHFYLLKITAGAVPPVTKPQYRGPVELTIIFSKLWLINFKVCMPPKPISSTVSLAIVIGKVDVGLLSSCANKLSPCSFTAFNSCSKSKRSCCNYLFLVCSMEFAFSAGSLSSTAPGLLQWQTALLTAAVIPQQTLQTMTTPHLHNYACGLVVNS